MSLSLDFSIIWPTVNSIVSNLWVLFAVPLGVMFGFGILGKIIKEVKSAISAG
jgi:hypothetical protein